MGDERKAVVLGGAGFLGRRLATLLVRPERGAQDEVHPAWPFFSHVHVFDRVPFEEPEEMRQRLRRAPKQVVTTQVGDIRSLEDLHKAVRGAHTVFHLASLVDTGLRHNPLLQAVNVEGTRNVLSACQEERVPFLVYTSSEDVALSPQPVRGGDESLPYPQTLLHDYVRTKVEGEKLVRAADGCAGLRTCCIRPVHIYGPGDPHAIKTSLREIGSGKVPFLLGDGSARFDVVYVDNVAHGHLLAAARLHDPSTVDLVGGRAFFVGEGNAINFFDFLRPYAAVKGVRMPRWRLPNFLAFVVALLMELIFMLLRVPVPFHRLHYYLLCHDFYFSNASAARVLGYEPLVSPAEAQRRTVEWVRAERL
jgi:sterol-4alpha-carboxylate 3-dehydrogenase (decarboxylating)